MIREDNAHIAADGAIPWDALRGGSVLVTGATGLIGAALVRALAAANRQHGLALSILAAGRDEKRAKPLVKDCGAVFLRQDIREPLALSGGPDYIFHCAAVTKSAEMAANPAGVAETSVLGTLNVLNAARDRRVKSMVYLSSMEMYGVLPPSASPLTEDMLGYLDLSSPRSCYPESKRMAECLCGCYAAQYGVPVKIARLAQTFGAGTPGDDPRVFAQFARSAMAGENIVLHTQGDSLGNYCYISDAVRALLLLLLKGENGGAYNVVNPEACMSVREMAGLVAQRTGGRTAVVVRPPADIQSKGYAPDSFARLGAGKMLALGWRPAFGLADMYARLMSDWSETGAAE